MNHNILSKAFYSALIGLPVSWCLNVTFLPILNGMIHENVLLAGILLSLPFLVASTVRIYVIDYVYHKYSVDLSPENIIRKIRMKC